MALTNTITGYVLNPFFSKSTDVSPKFERLQTSGNSGATAGSVPIFASATVTDNFVLDFVNISMVNPTNTAAGVLYLGTDAIAYLPTQGAGTTQNYNFNFGCGLVGGTTTTATVSLVTSGGTVTAYFAAAGWRKR